jgi:Holliday junction resolvase
MSNYAKGYNLEWKVKDALAKKGFLVLRSPASKSEMDIIALNKGEIYFIQCKKTGKNALYLYGLYPLVELARKYGAKPLLAYSLYYTPVYVKEVTGDSERILRDEKHRTLDEYFA